MHPMEQVWRDPSGERTPVVLGLYQQVFDEIKLKVVRRQRQQHEAVANHPLLKCAGV